MAFVDELIVRLKAGDGGDGVVRFRHEKYKEYAGPSGGDGGRGGNFIIKGVRDLAILSQYRHQKEYAAQNGEHGRGDSEHGANGEDFVFKLPVGCRVTNIETGDAYELEEEGQEIIILRGGGGGMGNERFKGPENQAPQESTPGKPGRFGEFRVELLLFADVGLIGLPSAGKTSLLNALTNTKAKVAEYHFTTLEPNLGALYNIIVADIPGLIEGASEGKGLGHKFLRHIERTGVLAHCIGFDTEDALDAYRVVRGELEAYSPELATKREIIVLTKTDMASQEQIDARIKQFSSISDTIITVSVLDDASLKTCTDTLIRAVTQ